MTKEYLDVANEILRQIRATAGWAVVGSWGFERPIGMPPRDGFRGGALKFKVSGRLHKGWVAVELTVMDDYTISLFKPNGDYMRSVEGIYADQIGDVIDRMVETP